MECQSSPPTVDEYFKDFCIDGKFPSNRRANFDSFVLLKADGAVRGKVGIKRERATGRLGSFDLDANRLTIVDHDFYPELVYPTGYWCNYENALDGDALSVTSTAQNMPAERWGLAMNWRPVHQHCF